MLNHELAKHIREEAADIFNNLILLPGKDVLVKPNERAPLWGLE